MEEGSRTKHFEFQFVHFSCSPEFFLWEDLGHGADGKAFLVSGGTKGAVGVLKFFFTDAESKAKHELRMWNEVYAHLPPVAQTVRVVTVMVQTTLLIPWFQCPGNLTSHFYRSGGDDVERLSGKSHPPW